MQGQQDNSTHTPSEPTQTTSGLPQTTAGAWSLRPHPTRKGMLNLLIIGTLLGAPSVAQATDLLPLPPELGTWGIVVFAVIEALREVGKWFHNDQAAKAKEQEIAALREALNQSNNTLAKLQAQRDQEQREAMMRLYDEIKALRQARQPS
jgi:hypothetical protein